MSRPVMESFYLLFVALVVITYGVSCQSETLYTGLTGMDVAKMLASVVKKLPGKIPKERNNLEQRMKRVLFHNTTAICNDGTPAGYYIRRVNSSKRWIVFLEGGWYCFNERTCVLRWRTSRNLMSSRWWADSRTGSGILSTDSSENPHLWNANHVYVPYCSSDGWSGMKMASNANDFSFMGAAIIQQVFKDLQNSKGLGAARTVFLSGSSAGGAGVFLNIDSIADYLRLEGCDAKIRGIADSGWFMDNEPFEKQHSCTDVHDCDAVTAIQSGLEYWNGQLPERCTQDLPKTDHWKCYFGYRIYPTLRTPTFVIQWLVDEAQITIDNVGTPVSKAQWAYIHSNLVKLHQSLQNVTALFLPSCISHTILLKPDWGKLKIRNRSLPQALRCWESQPHEHNHHEHHASHHLYDRIKRPRTDRTNIRKRKKNRRSRSGGRKRNATTGNLFTKVIRFSSYREARQDPHFSHQWKIHDDLCSHRLVDQCDFPQCNLQCPKLKNPQTGEDIELTDLLRSFGLDMNNAATILGMNVSQLYGMKEDVLLEMLNSHHLISKA